MMNTNCREFNNLKARFASAECEPTGERHRKREQAGQSKGGYTAGSWIGCCDQETLESFGDRRRLPTYASHNNGVAYAGARPNDPSPAFRNALLNAAPT